MEQYYRERLSVQPAKVHRRIDIVNEDLDKVSKAEIKMMTQEQRQQLEHRIEIRDELKLDHACKYVHSKRLKPLLTRNDVTLRSEGRDITLTRYLGHKVDMPGSG